MSYTDRQRRALARPRFAFDGQPRRESFVQHGRFQSCLEIIHDGRGGLNWAASISLHRKGRPVPIRKWKRGERERANRILDELLVGLDRPPLDLEAVYERQGCKLEREYVRMADGRRKALVALQRWLSVNDDDRTLAGRTLH